MDKREKFELPAEGEPTKEELLMNEQDIISGLLSAANTKDQTETIAIKRGDAVLFRFRICGLTDEEVEAVRERHSVYARNNTGFRVLEKFDDLRFKSDIIYNATVEDDRKKVWDNPTVKSKLNLLAGIDVIDKVLLSGEKDAIYERVQLLSGFGKGKDMVEQLKN